jgi:hypothetical protein
MSKSLFEFKGLTQAELQERIKGNTRARGFYLIVLPFTASSAALEAGLAFTNDGTKGSINGAAVFTLMFLAVTILLCGGLVTSCVQHIVYTQILPNLMRDATLVAPPAEPPVEAIEPAEPIVLTVLEESSQNK